MAERIPMAARAWEPGDEARFTPGGQYIGMRQPWDWTRGPPGPTWTLTEGDGALTRPVHGIAGLVEYSPGRFHLWAWVGELTDRQWYQALAITDQILRRFHQQRPDAEVTATAVSGAAQRALERIGFTLAGETQLAGGLEYRTLRKAA